MKLVKWLLWVVLFLVVIATGGAIFLVSTVDPNDLKPQISQQVESATGRKLTLGGDLSWQFYPWVGVTINDFALSNREGFDPEQMLEAEKVDVQVKLLPLISKQLEIGQVELQSPKIRLSINAQGETNWDDLTGDGSAPTEDPEQAAGAMLGGLVIQGVNISEGDIIWDDQAADQRYHMNGFNLSTGAIEPGVPIDVDLRTNVSGTALPADARIELAGALLLNEAMDALTLSNLNSQLGMDKLAAKLGFASLSFSLASGQLAMTDIRLEATDEELGSGQMNINALNFALESGLLDIDRIDGKASMDQITADLNAEGLDFALESQQLDVRKLLYSGQYDPFPFQGELDEISFNLNTSTLQVASHTLRSEYNGLPLLISGARLQADIDQETLVVPELNIAMEDANINVNLQASQLLGEVQVSGHLVSRQFNPRALLTKLGIEALADMPDQAMQSMVMETDFAGGLSSLTVEKLRLELDQSTLTGGFSLNDFDQPAYRFALNLDRINVDNYLSADNQAVAEETGPAAAVVLPFAELKGLDVKGEIKIGEFQIMDLVSNDVVITVDAEADRIDVSSLNARLYGGEIMNSLVYDISGDTPGVKINSSMLSLHLGPFLQAMQITDRFEGLGNVSADLESAGLAIDEAISNLNGQIDIALNDGAIRGVDIQKSLIKVESAINALAGKELGLSADIGDRTEFSEFNSHIQIQQGVMTISDINLMAPAIRVSGGGQVDLNTEQMDLTLNVAVVESFEGQGGASLDRLKGQTIPMKITGTLDSPSILPDISKILQGELEKKISEKYLGGESVSGESFDDALKSKLNEKLSKELGVSQPGAEAGAAGAGATSQGSSPDTGSTAVSPEPEADQPPAEPQKLEDQLKEQLKGKLMKGLFGG